MVLAGMALGCSGSDTLTECRAVAEVINPELSHIASEYGNGSRVEAAGWQSLAERYEQLGRKLANIKLKEASVARGRRDLQVNFAEVAPVLRRIALAKEQNDQSLVARTIAELSPLQRRHSSIVQSLGRVCQAQ
jgi:hypothetical protein